jgi:bifunctional non-homologous end joining protein LigD
VPTVKSIELFFQEGKSDKLYAAQIVETAAGKYDVVVQWGRRGSTLNRGKKAVGVALAAAEKAFARLVHEKTSKGYEEVTAAAGPQAVAPPEGEGSGSKVPGRRSAVGRVAQLLNAIDEGELRELLDDDDVVAQQKIDGVRVLVTVGDALVATNRAGQATSAADGVVAGLAHLPPGTIVDGEVVAGPGGPTYWLFDVLHIGDEDVSRLGYEERYMRLAGDLEPGLFGPVAVLPVATGRRAKRALADSLRAARAEGIVFKRRDAPYTAGRPASGGTQLKHKFVKRADIVIVENAGNAYRMAVHDGAALFDVGKVFAGTTNELRRALDELLAAGAAPVAEVAYLYATDDDQLYQPVFVRLRDDKTAADCRREQLARTSRAVITRF